MAAGFVKLVTAGKRTYTRKRPRISKFAKRIRSHMGPRSTLPYAAGPMGPNRRATMSYFDTVAITLPNSGTVPGVNEWGLNALFLPDLTNLANTHKPLYFNQYIASFRKYKVYAFDYDIQIVGASADSGSKIPMLASLVCTVDTTYAVTNSIEYAIEKPGSSYRIFNQDSMRTGFKGHVNIPKLCGIPATEYRDDEEYEGTNGSNPTKIPRIILSLQNANRATGNPTFRVTVRFTYHSVFFDPFTVPRSI